MILARYLFNGLYYLRLLLIVFKLTQYHGRQCRCLDLPVLSEIRQRKQWTDSISTSGICENNSLLSL